MAMLMESDELNYSAVIFPEMWCESSRLHHYPIGNVLFFIASGFEVILFILFFTEWSNSGAGGWYSDSSGH